MKTIQSILVLFIISAGNISRAQDGTQLIQKMNRLYANANSFSMVVEVNMFSKAKQPQPDQVITGKVKKWGPEYYSEIMGKVLLSNKEFCAVLDDRQKVIVFFDPEKKQSKELQAYEDSSLIDQNSFIVSGENGKNYLRFPQSKESLYSFIDLDISPDGKLEEIIFIYKAGKEETASPFEKISVKYKEIRFDGFSESERIKVENYLTRNGKNWNGVGKYANYNVQDQRAKK
jgi:hypothetical protein